MPRPPFWWQSVSHLLCGLKVNLRFVLAAAFVHRWPWEKVRAKAGATSTAFVVNLAYEYAIWLNVCRICIAAQGRGKRGARKGAVRAKCAQLKSLRALATTNESIDAFLGQNFKLD